MKKRPVSYVASRGSRMAPLPHFLTEALMFFYDRSA